MKRYVVIGAFVTGLSTGTALASPIEASTLPSGGAAIEGQVSFEASDSSLSVHQSTPQAIVQWDSFSIGQDASVVFNQPSTSSVVLNRVVSDSPSSIYGRLESNGKVFLINPYGVMFGSNSSVDVGGLVASTLNISNEDFLAGRFRFTHEGGSGSVLNEGFIKTPSQGYVAFISPLVENDSVIDSSTVALVAGSKVSLNFSNDKLINFTLDEGAVNAQVFNNDLIRSNNGAVMLSAKGVEALTQSVVNNSGVIEATGFGESAGRISLHAVDGEVIQQGSLSAPGGQIEVQGSSAYFGEGQTSVAYSEGQGGTINVSTTNKIITVAGHHFDASGKTGGQVVLDASENGGILSSSSMSADGTTLGGYVALTGRTVGLLSSQLSANGSEQGGRIHVGGAWQGQGPLRNAEATYVAGNTHLRATSDGLGGEIVVWSNQFTDFAGSADAGGMFGGNVEISSNGQLSYTGYATAGLNGHVLFDPKDITIAAVSSGFNWVTSIVNGGLVTLASNDQFGSSVAIDGDKLAVGATGDSIGGSNRGAVYLFTGANSSNMSSLALQTKLASGQGATGMVTLAAGDWFGSSVALDGDRLAVGAKLDDTGGFNYGAVHLFTGVGSNFSGLTYAKKLGNSTGATSMPALGGTAWFGSGVALNGDMLAVTRPQDGASKGQVFLFNGVGTDFSGLAWQKTLTYNSGATSLPALPISGDDLNFGSSVAIDGDRLAVGAYNYDTNGTYVGTGAVYLFTGIGTDFSGLTYARLVAPGVGATGMPTTSSIGINNNLGWSVDLEGDNLIIGQRYYAHYFTGATGDFSGLTYKQKIMSSPSDATGSPSFSGLLYGTAVAISGSTIVSGINSSNEGAVGVGSVHFFNTGGTADAVSSATYANNPNGSSTISPSSITTILNAGSNVTLQANNDITVSAAVSANNPSGNGGAFSLNAGRHININAAITTDGGNFTAVAGDSSADATYTSAGSPVLTQAAVINTGAGTTLLKSKGNVSVSSDITTTTGSIILNSDCGGVGAGRIVLNPGVDLTTSGGGIVLGGGTCDSTGCTLPAQGVNAGEMGINLAGASGNPITLNSNGGQIWMSAKGASIGGLALMADYVSMDSGPAGAISITAQGVYGSGDNGHSLLMRNGTTLRGGSGGLYIIARGDLTPSSNYSYGLVSDAGAGAKLYTTNGGALSLNIQTRNIYGSPFYFTSGSPQLGDAVLQNGDINILFNSINQATDLGLPPIYIPTGNLSVTSNMAIGSGSATTVGGATTLTAGGSNRNVVFNGGSNNFTGAVSVANAQLVNLVSAGPLNLGNITASDTIYAESGVGSNLTLNNGATIQTTSTSQNAITLVADAAATPNASGTGGQIINNHATLQVGAGGAWRLYSGNPTSTVRWTMTPTGKRYNTDNGSDPIAAGNRIYYRNQPSLTVSPGTTLTYGSSFTPTELSYAGLIDGDTVSTAGLSGDPLFSATGLTSSSGNLIAGVHTMGYVGGLTSDKGYGFVAGGVAPVTVNAKPVLLQGVQAASKPYDGTTVATIYTHSMSLNPGLLVGDVASLDVSNLRGAFLDPRIGVDKPIAISGIVLTGADADNYALMDAFRTKASIFVVEDNSIGALATTSSGRRIPSIYQGREDQIALLKTLENLEIIKVVDSVPANNVASATLPSRIAKVDTMTSLQAPNNMAVISIRQGIPNIEKGFVVLLEDDKIHLNPLEGESAGQVQASIEPGAVINSFSFSLPGTAGPLKFKTSWVEAGAVIEPQGEEALKMTDGQKDYVIKEALTQLRSLYEVSPLKINNVFLIL